MEGSIRRGIPTIVTCDSAVPKRAELPQFSLNPPHLLNPVIMVRSSQMVDSEALISKILGFSWTDLDHEKVKFRLGSLFTELGFSVTFEYYLEGRSRNGYVDLVANDEESGLKIGVEIDRAAPKLKSIEKLRKLNPDLALMILRADQIPEHKIWQRVCSLSSDFVVLNLSKRCIVFSNLS